MAPGYFLLAAARYSRGTALFRLFRMGIPGQPPTCIDHSLKPLTSRSA